MNIRLNSLKLLAFIQLILITVMLYVGSLQAQSPEPQSFTYYRAFPVQADCNTTHRGLAGNIKTLFIKYDALHQTFLIDSLVERCSATGHLANSFAGAFNGGPNPKGHPGELAKIQADFRNPSHPIITVYGYNGVANSWLDGFRDTDVNGIPGMPGLQTPD
ncbi:MAG: hypothetical protein KDD60_08190, partial [Bdellovibrionales bacterium]|nr:hypothetical protein [Bdellovibrionales bacterium]